MPLVRWSWREIGVRRRGGRAGARRRLGLEWLEDRTLLSGSTLETATPLVINSFGTAKAAGFLADPHEVDLYRVHLGPGDILNAGVIAQGAGSGLQSLLRIFDDSGRQVALDDQEGGDSRLTFQGATAGDYFVGISSAPNDGYDPTAPDSGSAGGTTGVYTLNLRDAAHAPLRADLVGSSFRLGVDTAAY